MKTKILSLFGLCTLMCMVLLFPSCNPEPLSVHDVEGDYDGKVEAEHVGKSLGITGMAHTVVTSPDNQKLTVAFENLTVAAFELGSFEVDCGVQYDEKAGAFNLYGEPQVVFEKYGKLPVQVSGASNPGILVLTLDITSLNLKLTYNGFLRKKK